MASDQRLKEFCAWLSEELANWSFEDFRRYNLGLNTVSWRQRADAAGFGDIPNNELPPDKRFRALFKIGPANLCIRHNGLSREEMDPILHIWRSAIERSD